MQPILCRQVNALKWIESSESTQVNTLKWMHSSECTQAGWDIPGEPGNRVPRKSLDIRRNILQESQLSHDKYKRKNDFLLKEIISCPWGNFHSKSNNFLSKSSCQNKWFIVKGNDFMSKEKFCVKRNEFLSKEMISCQRKLIPAKWKDSLSKEINYCHFQLREICKYKRRQTNK
jgi:hypothetical protein